ncbi:MAG: Xaa-Pro peptidase family protein [Ignavibacteriales bacterium]|nr:Xaa-Pro peptidase family protein [Ignavibacteriales bacterium]
MFERRLQEVRKHLETSGLDALLVSHLPHVRYLTGFSGSNGLCVVTLSKQYFLTDNRYREQSKTEIDGFEIVITSDTLLKAARKRGMINGKKKIGFESQYLSVSTFENLKKLFPSASFVSKRSVIETIAAVKEESEIEAIKRAAAITDKVFRKVLLALKPGVRELDIAAEISYWHQRFGADGDAFESIVASGPRGALPHGRATEKRIRKGEFVTLDFGCKCKGYNSDLTRTVAVGPPTERGRKIYRIVLEAQRMAIEATRPGVPARNLDRVARRHIRQKGFGKYFSHSLGHGLGIEIHEPLRLSVKSKDVVRVGNVFTIEPGIYLQGVGGVRIEDDVVVRESGCEVITKSPKELMIL